MSTILYYTILYYTTLYYTMLYTIIYYILYTTKYTIYYQYIYIYIYSIRTSPQYLTRGGIEAIREYLESFDKPISSTVCAILQTLFWRIIIWKWGVKVPSKRVLLLGPSSLLHILTCLWQGYKTEFFKIVCLNVVTIPWWDFLYMDPKFSKLKRAF